MEETSAAVNPLRATSVHVHGVPERIEEARVLRIGSERALCCVRRHAILHGAFVLHAEQFGELDEYVVMTRRAAPSRINL